jgi:hypothetical protein
MIPSVFLITRQTAGQFKSTKQFFSTKYRIRNIYLPNRNVGGYKAQSISGYLLQASIWQTSHKAMSLAKL